ncbi:MAG TPA: acetate--CoA ligase family protein [Xanthobacteraceae bacterium]|nr:acetate--CoA ligase family protein [Xanthobacteraceae bacterium]
MSLAIEASPLLLHSLGKVDALLNPRNVVILGASDSPGNWSQRVWRNVNRYKFPGPIYPLNPRRDEIWETRCYRSFAALPEPPDHVVVVIPAAFVPDALVEAKRAGARSATVLTAGFGESADPAAHALSAKLKAVIAETGLAVSGPNCFGNLHARSQLMTMPDDRMQRLVNGPVAIIGQSGGLAMSIKRSLEERGIDAGSVVTSGNQAGLSSADYIAYYAMNDDIAVIVSYLEAVQNPAAFMAACRMARAAGKPIVMMKLGASAEGRAAALAHTGALAGAMEAFDAVAGGAGVLRVRTVDDVVESVEYILHAPPLSSLRRQREVLAASSPGLRGGEQREGLRLGAITFSGALRGLLLDAAAANGLAFAALAPSTRERLAAVLGVGTIVGNPLDSGFTGLTNRESYVKCIEAMLDDPGIDLVLLQAELPRAAGMDRAEANMRAVEEIAARAKKPIVQFSMGSHGLSDYSRAFRASLPHVPCLQEVDKTLRTVRALSDYAARAGHSVPTAPPTGSKGKARLDKILVQGGKAGARTLNEVQSKKLLKAYGLLGPAEAVARSADKAVAMAKVIGYPVVAKAVSAALPHKSDIGAVKLGLDSAKAVRAAYKEIVDAVVRHSGGQPEGVLVAEQVSDGLELVLGANLDPEVGPVILFGSGGVALELYRDVALAPPPLNEERALALIARTRAGKLVHGYRGQPPLDVKALVRALIGLSALMLDADGRIQSVDVNPFLLRRRGGVALDGLVVLADHGA